jgi:glycosyltransferase involved in cell wall biosynthesis
VGAIRELGVDHNKIDYYPNSAEDFYKPLPRESASISTCLPPGFRVMFAGNIGQAQGFETILAAAELLKENAEIQWLIVGDGRKSDWVAAEIKSRGLQDSMHLLGHQPPESMANWFAHADAMLVSLRGDPIFAMTIPAKVQSYLACGRPIVASLNGEGARVIRDAGAGITAPADDPKALAHAVMEMYKLSSLDRERLGARGRNYFERHFERDALIEKLVSLMEQARREYLS